MNPLDDKTLLSGPLNNSSGVHYQYCDRGVTVAHHFVCRQFLLALPSSSAYHTNRYEKRHDDTGDLRAHDTVNAASFAPFLYWPLWPCVQRHEAFMRRLSVLAIVSLLTACHERMPPADNTSLSHDTALQTITMPGEPITKGLDSHSFRQLFTARLDEHRQQPEDAARLYLAQAHQYEDHLLAARAAFSAQQSGNTPLFQEATTLWQRLLSAKSTAIENVLSDDDIRMMRLLCEQALQAQQWSQALSWQLALDRHGHHDAIDGMLETWMAVEQPLPRAALRAQVDRYLREHPTHDETAIVCAALLAGEGRSHEAFAELRQILDRHPYNLDALFAKALIEQRQGCLQEALQTLNLALSHDEAHELRIVLLRIDLELDLQHRQQAYAHMEQFLSQLPPSGQSINELAQFLLDHHHPDAAAHLLTQHPLLGSDVHDEAITSSRQALFGVAADLQNNDSAAFRSYIQVTPASPLFAHAQLRLLSIIQTQEGASAAARLMRTQRERFPDQLLLLVQLELGALQQGHQEESARRLLEKTVDAHPEHDGLRYLRAMQRVQRHETNDALKDLDVLVRHQPNNPIFLNAYGYTLTDLAQRYDQALPVLRKAIALAPGNAEIEDSLGWTLQQLGQHQEAEQWLKQAYAGLPSLEIAEHYLLALSATGNMASARELLATLLRSPKLGASAHTALRQRFAHLLPAT